MKQSQKAQQLQQTPAYRRALWMAAQCLATDGTMMPGMPKAERDAWGMIVRDMEQRGLPIDNEETFAWGVGYADQGTPDVPEPLPGGGKLQ